MKQKINKRLIGIAVLAVFATLVCMTVIYYGLFQKQVQKDLRTDAQVLKDAGVFSREKSDSLNFSIDMEDLRITWIDADGTVLYDNDTDAEKMENHAGRPEVKAALAEGSGEIVRTSDTMGMNTFYYALRLEDGTVLRVSTQARSIFNVFLNSFPSVLLLTALIVLVCVVLAHYLTKQLLEPIEEMAENLEEVPDVSSYKELVPFVNTIRAQHENILMAAKVRQDFTANVSHELKTPLTAISGYAELIENHMASPEQESRFAGEIRQNANRLLALIDDIIRLSELDNEEIVVTYEDLDLDEVAYGCVENLRLAAEKRNVTLTYKGEPCPMRANRGMMGELIDNLGSNAIRYNNPGGSVRITVKKEKDRPVLTVEDDGIGIPKDQQERVFERFYRVDKSRSKETGGTGLGLAIVKHIAELHDAAITVDSEPGKGTKMRVEF